MLDIEYGLGTQFIMPSKNRKDIATIFDISYKRNFKGEFISFDYCVTYNFLGQQINTTVSATTIKRAELNGKMIKKVNYVKPKWMKEG